MNEKDFAALMHGVKEMVAHVRGEDVPGLRVTTVADPDVHAIREAAAVTQKELAALLGVSRRTVESHLQRVYRKLDVHSRTQLAARLHEGR